MITLRMLLLIIAVACFAGAAVGVPAGRVNLLGLGLFCWALADLAR